MGYEGELNVDGADFAPYNITFVDGCVHGIIDFDTLHPGPRIWDVAYMRN